MTKMDNYHKWIQSQRNRAIRNNEPIYSVRQGTPQDRLPKQQKRKASEPKLASPSKVSELLGSPAFSMSKLIELWGELPPSSYTVVRQNDNMYIYDEVQQKEVFRRRYEERAAARFHRISSVSSLDLNIWYDRDYFKQEYVPEPEPKKISIGI